MSFNIGDIVKLKSGGPRMTVGKQAEGSTHCHWFEGKERNFHPFPTGVLELASEADARETAAMERISRSMSGRP